MYIYIYTWGTGWCCEASVLPQIVSLKHTQTQEEVQELDWLIASAQQPYSCYIIQHQKILFGIKDWPCVQAGWTLASTCQHLRGLLKSRTIFKNRRFQDRGHLGRNFWKLAEKRGVYDGWLRVFCVGLLTLTLKLQIAQTRYYLHTLGPKVGII